MSEVTAPEEGRVTTWVQMCTFLDSAKHTDVNRYRTAVTTLLMTAGSRIGEYENLDDVAVRMRRAAASYQPRTSRRPGTVSGYTELAAHTSAVWLVSLLGARLPRLGGELDLHQDLDHLVAAVWGPPGPHGVAQAVGRLQRSAAARAGELRAVGAHTVVRYLSGYATAQGALTPHGRLVYNTLLLALPLEHQDPGGDGPPRHLTLSQALDWVMSSRHRAGESPAPAHRHRRFGPVEQPGGPAGHTPVSLYVPPGGKGPLDAFQKAVDVRPRRLVRSPLTGARGVLPMLWHGQPTDAQALDDEMRQMLAVAYLLGGRYHQSHRRVGPWSRLHAGLVVLAAETSVRTLHALLAQEHGPEGFEILELLIPDLHPYEARDQGRLAARSLDARRLLTGYCAPLFEPWQSRAVKAIADATASTPVMKATRLARISAEVYVHCRQHPDVVARARRDAIGAHLASAREALRISAAQATERAQRRLVMEQARWEKEVKKRALRQWREDRRAEREEEVAELALIRQGQREAREQDQAARRQEAAERALARAREEDGFLEAFTELLREGLPILHALQELEVPQSRLRVLRRRQPEAGARITAAYREGALARAHRKNQHDGSQAQRDKGTRAIVLAALRDGSDLVGAATEASTTPRWIIGQYVANFYFRQQVIRAYDQGPAALLEDLEEYGYRRGTRIDPTQKTG